MADASKPAKKTAAAKPTVVQHDVTVTDSPDSFVEQGGTVRAMCTCGWNRSVRYNRDRLAAAARTQMRTIGEGHADDPDAPEPLS